MRSGLSAGDGRASRWGRFLRGRAAPGRSPGQPGPAAAHALGAPSVAARRCGCGGATSSSGSSSTTLLMSLGVVLLLGFVVIGQVRNGLLDAKVQGRRRARPPAASPSPRRRPTRAAAPRRARAPRGPTADRQTRRVDDRPRRPARQRRPGRLRRGRRSAPTPAGDGAGSRGAAWLGQRRPGRERARAPARRTWATAARAPSRRYTRIRYTDNGNESQPGARRRQAAQRHRTASRTSCTTSSRSRRRRSP